MLSQMREGRFIRTVLWIVVVAFVATMVFVWGADLQGVGCNSTQAPQGQRWVGMVGDTGLSLRDYDQSYRAGLSQMNQNRRPDQVLTEEERQRMSDQIFNEMVNMTLFSKEVERLGLSPSDEEVAEVLQFDPPEILRRQFQDEQGQFDRNAYQLALNNPNIDWRPFESVVRADIPRQRLVQMVTAAVHVGEGDVRQEFERQFAKAKVRYAGRTWRDVDLEEDEPADEVLQHYFQENIADYQESERYVIKAVKISREPSPADEAYVAQRMDFIRGEVLGGKSFGDMAQDYSMDLSNAEKGGDLGWFGRGRMHPEFEEAAFALADGEVSEAVRTSFGLHLIKKEAGRVENGVEEINARHILLRIEPSYATQDSVAALTDSLHSLATSLTDLGAAAEQLGLEVLSPPPFGEADPMGELGYNSSIKARLALLKPGAVSRRFTARDADYMVQLVEVLPAGPSEFETRRSKVLRDWQSDQKQALARESVQALLDRMGQGASLGDAAAALELEVTDSEPFRRIEYLEGIGSDTAFQQAAHLLNPGDVSGLVETGQGFYVLEVLERIPSDKGIYKDEKPVIYKELLEAEQRSVMESWLDALKARHDIKDFRDEFYG